MAVRKTKSGTESTTSKTRRRVPANGSTNGLASTSVVDVPVNGSESVSVVISADEIAREAYHLFLSRNGREGDALEDWLTAERLVVERKQRAIAPGKSKSAAAPRRSRRSATPGA